MTALPKVFERPLVLPFRGGICVACQNKQTFNTLAQAETVATYGRDQNRDRVLQPWSALVRGDFGSPTLRGKRGALARTPLSRRARSGGHKSRVRCDEGSTLLFRRSTGQFGGRSTSLSDPRLVFWVRDPKKLYLQIDQALLACAEAERKKQ